MPAHLPSQSAEDYLERIHELISEKGYARVVDIASSLRVQRASVTSMVQKLGELGYLHYEKYRGLVLTPRGREVAQQIQERHNALERFFSLLGLSPQVQKADIEGLEHHLSPETLRVVADLTEFLASQPNLLGQFLAFRSAQSPPAPAAHTARQPPARRAAPRARRTPPPSP